VKAVILAGGKGTRISEETSSKPKPLIDAAGKPLIWHIMQNFYLYGITEFIVLAGYKGIQIKEYFANYWMMDSDISFDLSSPAHLIENSRALPWQVTVLDTGVETMTGGRIKSLRGIVNETFLLTYGDGVSDINISDLIAFHRTQASKVTLTAVQPPARFGALKLDNDKVIDFEEKPTGDGSWINGGFFVLEPEVLDLELSESSVFESDVLPMLARAGELAAYKYDGFWQPVDTLRDLHRLEERISSLGLPWL
jgi:glucose-1-phosphate cytidylyltransferase